MSQENIEDESVIDLDATLAQLGRFGKYNIVNYALLLFPVYLAGMSGLVFVFEAPDISYRCEIKQCESFNPSLWLEYMIPRDKGELSKCKRYEWKGNLSTSHDESCSEQNFNFEITEKCDRYVYSDEDSVVKDFDLGCHNWKRTLIGTIHNSGLFISIPVTGIISDRYGRKIALSIASLLKGLFGYFRSFSTSYAMTLVLEFLETGLGGGTYSTAIVLFIELIGPKGKVFGTILINAVYVLGLMSLAGFSWWLQSWRQLLRIIYTPAMFLISYLWLLNESIRWLLSKGRGKEAAKVLKKAMKMNNVVFPDDVLAAFYEIGNVEDSEKQKNLSNEEIQTEVKKPSTFIQVIKSQILRKRMLVCSFLWITCTVVFYGLSINSVSLDGNKYINFMLVAFVEIPANLVCLLVLNRYGRKRTLIISFLLSACPCISLSLLPKDQKWSSLVMYLSGKFSITVAYSSVYIYVSEVFPTSVRQSLLAVYSSLDRVVFTLAPLTPLLALYYDNLPTIFFGRLALVASAMAFTLPETINVARPDTVEEAERLSQRKQKKESV